MKQVLVFTNPFSGNLSNCKERWKKEDIEALGVTIPATVRVGLATDFYFFKVLRMMFSFDGTKEIKVCQKNGIVAVELAEGDTKQFCIFDGKDNTMKACCTNSSGAFFPYEEDKHGGTILKAAMLSYFSAHNVKLSKIIGDLYEYVKEDEDSDTWEDPLERDRLSQKLCAVTNICYYNMKDSFGSDKVKIEKLRASDLTFFKDAIPFYGNPSFCERKSTSGSKPEIGKAIRGKYAIDPDRKLSPLEEALVPKIPPSYVMDEVAETICKDLVESTSFEQAFRTVLLYGDSGSGKTSLAKVIAYLLNLPYCKATFSPDTDRIEIVGSILPNTDKIETKEIFKKLNLPTFEDVANDFEGSYKKLFGKEPDKFAAPEDCYDYIMKKVLEGVNMTEDFVFVPSNIIQAGVNGWVCEIQEVALRCNIYSSYRTRS